MRNTTIGLCARRVHRGRACGANEDQPHRSAAHLQHVSGITSRSELAAYTKKAIAEKLTDQQVRDIEIGKAHIGSGWCTATKLDQPRDRTPWPSTTWSRGVPCD